MSDLIRRGRSMTTAPSSDPPAQSASAATAPAMLDHVVVGPGASQAPASSSSSVAQPPSARRRHRPTDTIDTTSTDGTGASGSQSAHMVTLENKLSAILQSLAQSGIPFPHFDEPTSEPVPPEHPPQTTAPVDAQTSDPHIGDDSVDFDALFH
ncbi:hypothetical protein L3X38_027155 [Prunus dulcis]|uniref:Uncharacterized protein n=1 Tax=Prunus dulcis TaxID=3755 RepID=A0AAD4Z056_PRUDU|nr:hypothetical protein L3X38_027155 [Prunus dulcis]